MSSVTEKSLDRYELVERIAVGGMAEVFRAKAFGAHGFEKTLAIKRILPDLARDREFEERFIAEAKVAVRLSHANVVQVLDFGRLNDSLFIAMEFVDGLDLAALLKAYVDRGEQVPIAAALHISIEISRALDFAHQHGVVHRDVSPSNILLSRAGEVKIADFGIAVAAVSEPKSRPGQRRIMGKWRYMSPEQARGDELTTASDLFSAAAVLYELFTGCKLFPGEDAQTILNNIHSMELPLASQVRAGLPPALDEVLAKALARDASRRPGRAAEMQRALTEISYDSSIVATGLDVADAVNHVLGPAADIASPAARPGLDDLIRQQLMGMDSEARATARGTDVLAPGDLDSAGAGHQTTIVRAGIDAEGLTLWEIGRDHTIAAAPKAIREGRGTGAIEAISDGGEGAAPAVIRRRVLVGAVAATLLAGVVGLVYLSKRGTPAPVLVAEARVDAGTDASAPSDAHSIARTTAVIDFNITPAGASVVVDGVTHDGVTPLSIEVEPDVAHRIEVELAGYEPYVLEAETLRAGETLRVQTQLVRAMAKLEVRSDPTGAMVSLDGVELGTTPLNRAGLSVRKGASLLISKSGFQPVEVKVDLVGGEVATVSRSLKAAVRYGEINLFIEEGWADIYLRGKNLGRAPIKGLKLPVGSHELRLVNPPSNKEKTLQVIVDPDEVKYYRTKL